MSGAGGYSRLVNVSAELTTNSTRPTARELIFTFKPAKQDAQPWFGAQVFDGTMTVSQAVAALRHLAGLLELSERLYDPEQPGTREEPKHAT